MTEPTVTDADRARAKQFQGALENWFCGKRGMGDVLIEAFARHREAAEQGRDKAVLAWLRRQINGYPLNVRYAEAIATGKHLDALNPTPEQTHDQG